MFCCGKGRLLAKFFEEGFGRFLLILLLLLIVFYSAYFTISTFCPKTFPPNQLIKLKPGLDLFMSKNDTDYAGYIRFETMDLGNSDPQPKRMNKVKVVLQSHKDSAYRYSVKIELFDKAYGPVYELLFERNTFAPAKSGYSYNVLPLTLPEPYTIDDVGYFRYSFIEEETDFPLPPRS
ncbi:MAG: hypothetical protein ABIG31_06185 [Candidatus Omnitrophota bacterium]